MERAALQNNVGPSAFGRPLHRATVAKPCRRTYMSFGVWRPHLLALALLTGSDVLFNRGHIGIPLPRDSECNAMQPGFWEEDNFACFRLSHLSWVGK